MRWSRRREVLFGSSLMFGEGLGLWVVDITDTICIADLFLDWRLYQKQLRRATDYYIEIISISHRLNEIH